MSKRRSLRNNLANTREIAVQSEGSCETNISLDLPTPGNVALKIYDMLGQKVRTLVDRVVEAGYYLVRWDGKDKSGKPVSSGVYLYKLEAGSFTQMKKMCLVR